MGTRAHASKRWTSWGSRWGRWPATGRITTVPVLTLLLALFPSCFGHAQSARTPNTLPADTRSVQFLDAYIHESPDHKSWTVGTKSVELTYRCGKGQLLLTGFKNRLTTPPRDYVTPQSATAPFSLVIGDSAEQCSINTLWNHYLPAGATADPASDRLQVAVHKGDRIGFGVGAHGDYHGDQTSWPTTLTYASGAAFTSTDDRALAQGPIWRYYLRRPGTGSLESIDHIEFQSNAQERVRIPNATSGFRAPGDTPHVGATMLHPSNDFDAVRVWIAPMDGIVSIQGLAQHLRGYHDVDLSIFRLTRIPEPSAAPAYKNAPWMMESATPRQAATGGRPAVQLDLSLHRGSVGVVLHTLAYPGASVLRSWLTVQNHSAATLTFRSVTPLSVNIRMPPGDSPTQFWLVGGNNGPSQGLMRHATVDSDYHNQIATSLAHDFCPWTAWQSSTSARDGAFVALDYLGDWALRADRQAGGPVTVAASVAGLHGLVVAPNQRIDLPMTTLGVFVHDLDDLGARVYDWQYAYQWADTRDDYYARMQWDSAWYNDARNLQENFAGRLGQLDMDFPDMMRTVGMEVLWDDAGWSVNPNIWDPSRDGPDFALTQRYLKKMGMKWAVWFCGRPTPGLMDTKVGSWGDFQWRTDGIGDFDFAADNFWRNEIQRFRALHPASSFQTCNGGGSFGHQLDVQSYADINMFSDPGEGDQTNDSFSYLEIPDKWMDLMPSFGPQGKYNVATGRQILTMVPCWDLYATADDQEQLRRIADIYHYLLHEGVAGRWSYALHPGVSGDSDKYYLQRTSHDRTRACIVIKHQPTGAVILHPRGLLPTHLYTVGFDSTRGTTQRSGADLMSAGIALLNPPPGELVYLGLLDRPGSGRDHVPPTAPGRVFTRRETNVGHSGVGIYWSPGADSNWVSYYEVRRGDAIVGKASTGMYYFDHAEGWNARAGYAVRTIDGDGNASPWTNSARLPDEPERACALGGHFPTAGREGWSAETRTPDGIFHPMAWVAPVHSPAGDANGTPNQPGGAEGYWQGESGQRVGRGWQQSGSAADCVRVWTAPRAGAVRIVGRAAKEYYRRNQGGDLTVRILVGDRQIWPDKGDARVVGGDLVGCAHDIATRVASGDRVRFVLGQGASPENDIVAWMPIIEYQDSTPAPPRLSVLRIHCGSQTPFVDALGNRWSADTDYHGGTPVVTTGAIDTGHVDGAVIDQSLYRSGRQGRDFNYTIPVNPGLYTLRLMFAEPTFDWSFQRPFDVAVNGREVMHNFDICQAAHGPRRAYAREFHYLVPDAAGHLVVRFSGGWEPLQVSDQAMIQAIEVLPEIKPTARFAVGAERPFVDWDGEVWSAAGSSVPGGTLRSTGPVTQACPTLYDQPLYQAARNAKTLNYRASVPPGLYTVHLKIAELWQTALGKRPMDITINGRLLWKSWDPATATGKLGMAADLRAENIEPDAHGRISVRVTATGTNDAILQGLEIE